MTSPSTESRRVRFDELATLVNDRVDNPAESGVERYVGLEHLEADSLRIRQWGEITDVESTKLRFRPGDIIFGKRRVYQRKLAVADFEGICSAHAMVLRAKPEAVHPQFLPYFMQSDMFMERALAISVGSLSPTINWRDLAQQQFTLPPIEEQRRLSAALQNAQSCSDRLHDVALVSARLVESYLAHAVAGLAALHGTVPLGSLADVRYGLTVNPSRAQARTTVPYLRVANVQRGALDLGEVKAIGVLPADEEHVLRTGDVLMVEGHADPAQIGRAAAWNDELPRAMHQNHLIRARCGERLLASYLLAVVNSLYGRQYFRTRAKSSSGLNTINSGVVKELPIPLPPISVQAEVAERSSLLSCSCSRATERRMQLRFLASMLLRSAGSVAP